MARTVKHALALGVGAFLAGALAACGSGSSSTSSTAVSSVATTTTTSRSTATATKPATEAPQSSPSSSHTSGAAASFRAPHSDNSIPEYGQEAPTSERTRAQTALAAFLHARANGDWATVCTYLATSVRHEMEGFAKGTGGKIKGCGQVIGALQRGGTTERADPLTHGAVVLRVKGQQAFALFHGPKGSKYVMPMLKEHGSWKMGDMAPLPYPIGTPSPAAP